GRCWPRLCSLLTRPPTSALAPLALHDALPISVLGALSAPDRWRWTCGRGRRAADSPRRFQFQAWRKPGTAAWTQSTVIRNVDTPVSQWETGVFWVTPAVRGLVDAGQTG